MSNRIVVLIFDPDRQFAPAFRATLEKKGYEVLETRTIDTTLQTAEKTLPNVVLKPAVATGSRGLMERLRGVCPDTQFIFVQKDADVRKAMQAARRGAFDCLPLPCPPERLSESLRQALDHQRMTAADPQILSRLRDPQKPDVLAGDSPAMRQVKETITRVAASEVSVLVLGESGTGKELVARLLHERSRRAQGPFVAVNSAALPDSIIESELFGHVRGAFTGAVSDKPGRFALAFGGTLFLDEIGDLSPMGQADLLRVLEDGMYRPLGSAKMVRADVRIIAATHHDLEAACGRGTSREDLLYRLNVITLNLPPLRERPDDIAPLAIHLIGHFCQKHRMPPKGFTSAALIALRGFEWPGNVRQLRNVIERIVLLEPATTIDATQLPCHICGKQDGRVAAPRLEDLTLAEAEAELIRRALTRCGGNKAEAARRLGIARRTLHYKLRQKTI